MAFFFHSRSHEAFPSGYPIRIFEATNDKVRKKKTDERLSCNGGYSCDEEVTQQYLTMFSPCPKFLGLPRSHYCMSNDK
jgi:hypothetical protein